MKFHHFIILHFIYAPWKLLKLYISQISHSTSRLIPSDYLAVIDIASVWLQVQLSFMPEKIRAAVTSKEITPEEHSMQKGNDRKMNKSSSETLHSMPGHPCESDTSGASAVEHLDEEALKDIATETDFKLFKEAWKKSIDANEEVKKIISGILF